MQKYIILAIVLFVSSCTVIKAGKVSDEHKHLYDYNNSASYCKQNPDMCINNIPRF